MPPETILILLDDVTADDDDDIVARFQRPDARRTNRIRKLCYRHFGIGADGLIAVGPLPAPQDVDDDDGGDELLDFVMTYFNADGRPATLCGNGATCAVAHMHCQGQRPAAGSGELFRFVAADGRRMKGRIVGGGDGGGTATFGRSVIVRIQMPDVVDEVRDYWTGFDYFVDTGSPRHVRYVDPAVDYASISIDRRSTDDENPRSRTRATETGINDDPSTRLNVDENTYPIKNCAANDRSGNSTISNPIEEKTDKTNAKNLTGDLVCSGESLTISTDAQHLNVIRRSSAYDSIISASSTGSLTAPSTTGRRSIDDLDVTTLGRRLRHDARYERIGGTNVDLVEVDPTSGVVRARTFECGVESETRRRAEPERSPSSSSTDIDADAGGRRTYRRRTDRRPRTPRFVEGCSERDRGTAVRGHVAARGVDLVMTPEPVEREDEPVTFRRISLTGQATRVAAGRYLDCT